MENLPFCTYDKYSGGWVDGTWVPYDDMEVDHE